MDRVGAGVERCGVGPLVGARSLYLRILSILAPPSTGRLPKRFHEKPTRESEYL